MQAFGPDISDSDAVALGSCGGRRVPFEEREGDRVFSEPLSEGKTAYSSADYEDMW